MTKASISHDFSNTIGSFSRHKMPLIDDLIVAMFSIQKF